MKIALNRKMRVLIVEKDTTLGSDFHSMLQAHDDNQDNPINGDLVGEDGLNYKILHTTSESEALKLFERAHPDLILISDELEGGRELCRKVRKEEFERRTGIIFLAGSKSLNEMNPVECLELGADDYIQPNISIREMKARINAVLRLKRITDELRAANHRLQILSLTDELTGLDNMRSFNIKYGNYIRKCRGGEAGLAITMIDLDHFKSINDQTNHLVGSHVISEVGKLIKFSQIFPQDSCKARYGGDEYVVAYPCDSLADGMERAGLLRDLIYTSSFAKDGHDIKITCSTGVSWVNNYYNGPRDDPIKIADLMLYRSKKCGRNQVNGMELKNGTTFQKEAGPTATSSDGALKVREENRIAIISNIKSYK